jgi:hypothetical protein
MHAPLNADMKLVRYELFFPRETGQTIYIYRSIEERSRNHCCSRKALIITNYEWVSVAVVIQHAKPMRCVTLSSVPFWLYHVFPHNLIKKTRFKKNVENKMCFDFLCNVYLKVFLI